MAMTQNEEQFLSLLPWYLNGTLAVEQREWCERQLAESLRARQWLEREQSILAALPAIIEPVGDQVGLAVLQQRLATQRRQAQGASGSSRADTPGFAQRVAAWFSSPMLGGALALAVVAQFAVIGVLSQSHPSGNEGTRQVAVTEVRTLRVRFKEEVPEGRIRAALLAAGARVVGGPNQLGEYWLASPMTSVEEMRQSLLASGLVQSAVPDTQGPQ